MEFKEIGAEMEKIDKILELKEEIEEIQDEIISLIVTSDEESVKRVLKSMRYYRDSWKKTLADLEK
jgi:hypothetical protein